MKIHAMVWMAAVLCAAGGMAARGDVITGKSSPFRVDTRCKEFVIEDVKSAFCHGVYGVTGGKRATFLHGVTAEVEFTVSVRGKDIELTGGTVNGRDFDGSTFSFDVGTVPVGGELVVVARGTMEGEEVQSAPFVVNLDVARPLLVYGLTGLDMDFAGQKGYMEKGGVKFEIGSDAPHSSLHPWWLPTGVSQFSPLVGFRAEYSEGNGTFTFAPKLYSGSGTKKIQPRRSNGQFGKSFGIDYEMGVDGGMTFQWEPETLGWLAKSVELTGEVEGHSDWTWPFALPTPVGPIPMFAEVGVGAGAKTALTYHFPGVADGMCQASSWEWSLSSEKMPELEGALGVRVNHLVDVKGGVTANGVLEGNIGGPKGSHAKYGVKGTLFGMVEALGWTGKISADSETYWILGGEKGKSAKELLRVDWAPMRRDYSRKRRVAGGFETGGYPNPAPMVGMGGGRDFVGYLRDDGTRGDADRTEVVVQTGMDGEWGTVEKPWDDGTADWMPALTVAGDGTAVLAWANGKRVWGTATPEFGEVARSLELAVAVRDSGTGVWAARNLTDDNAADFGSVVCAAGNGTAMVAWLRNEGGVLFGSAEAPTAVMASRWDGNAWSASEELGRGAVSGLDLVYDGTNGCVVWAFDGDGDLETAGDVGVSAVAWNGGAWGAAAVLAEGLDGALPLVARVGADGAARCTWGENAVLMERAVDGTGEAVAAAVAWGGAVPGDARAVHGAVGEVALVWAEGEEGNAWVARPVAMRYETELGSWGGPVGLGEAEAGRMARGVSAAVGADGVLAAWESLALATNAEGEVEFGETELRVGSVTATGANPGIRADGFSFATNEVMAGELTGVQVTVVNTGMKEATNVSLRVWVCDGVLEEDEDARWELLGEDGEPVVLDLPGGAEVAATVWWMAEDYRTNLTFVARLEVPDGAEDADGTDNEAMWRPGTAELRLENARCDAAGAAVRLLTATVRNRGLTAADEGAVVSFRLEAPDGDEVGRDVAGRVLPGEYLGYDAGMTWNMAGGTWTGAWVTVYAVIDTRNAESDASTALPIRVMTPLDRDGDGLLDGEEEAMGTDPLNPDTNGDGVSDYEHEYVYFTDPLEGMEPAFTTNTPVKVPFTWLEQYADALAAHGGDHEAFAADTAANGRPVWACYVADLDPTDAGAQLKMRWQDGTPVYGPTSADRVYVLEGSEDLSNPEGWCNPTNARQRFFRVRVEVPQQ